MKVALAVALTVALAAGFTRTSSGVGTASNDLGDYEFTWWQFVYGPHVIELHYGRHYGRHA